MTAVVVVGIACAVITAALVWAERKAEVAHRAEVARIHAAEVARMHAANTDFYNKRGSAR